jgi:hypothetical protein
LIDRYGQCRRGQWHLNLRCNATRRFFLGWPALYIGPLFAHLDADGLNLPGSCAGHLDFAMSFALERDFSRLGRPLGRRIAMTLAQVRQ